MSITLNGITSDGTSVPIEVTADGKLVVDTSGIQGFIKQGDDIEAGSITGAGTLKAGTENFFEWRPAYGVCQLSTTSSNADQSLLYGQSEVGGSTTDAFKITCGGDLTAAGSISSSSLTATRSDDVDYVGRFICSGSRGYGILIDLANQVDQSSTAFKIKRAGQLVTEISDAGAFWTASGKCGFTADGELVFYSRGTRYKAVVQGGNVAAEPYTRAMELQEKAAQLRENAEDLKEPRTQDIVPED